MIETFAVAFGSSGMSGMLGEPRRRPIAPVAYGYECRPLPRVELPNFAITIVAAVRYPTIEEQAIFRSALWKSAKVVRRSVPSER